eukprot:m.1273583 g.1273583  ORF g.1273583 m.1273583 type:complete len:119 (+) comp24755_c1_seq9:2004-2360(+)
MRGRACTNAWCCKRTRAAMTIASVAVVQGWWERASMHHCCFPVGMSVGALVVVEPREISETVGRRGLNQSPCSIDGQQSNQLASRDRISPAKGQGHVWISSFLAKTYLARDNHQNDIA